LSRANAKRQIQRHRTDFPFLGLGAQFAGIERELSFGGKILRGAAKLTSKSELTGNCQIVSEWKLPVEIFAQNIFEKPARREVLAACLKTQQRGLRQTLDGAGDINDADVCESDIATATIDSIWIAVVVTIEIERRLLRSEVVKKLTPQDFSALRSEFSIYACRILAG
jgi:hypothetical protein